MSHALTLNYDRRLYVIGGEGGFSCLGFDYCYQQLIELVRRLYPDHDRPTVFKGEIGTPRQYQQYREALDEAARRGGFAETWFHAETPQAVRSILERYRKSGERLRIFLGDPETGRDWLEENDVVGRIGRSMGTMKIPLMLADGEYGGPGILDHCIVKMQDVETGRVLWKHPTYRLPELRIVDGAKRGRVNVLVDGQLHATFKTAGKAAAFVAFLAGETAR